MLGFCLFVVVGYLSNCCKYAVRVLGTHDCVEFGWVFFFPFDGNAYLIVELLD